MPRPPSLLQDDADAAAELKDVAALRADLALKVEELKEAVQEQATTRDVVKVPRWPLAVCWEGGSRASCCAD